MNDELALDLMIEFANSTGVAGISPPRRYLWTDAFAVCNFLGLYRHTRNRKFLDLAVELVDQVHHTLGRHRDDDPRRGWISGLPENEGALHPTRGGLRIGKTLNERPLDLPLDQRAEWDRDGQYYHYLTKWMHALHRMAQETGDARYQVWATELAVTAQRAFTRESAPGGSKRMVWKMSIDLSRPLVPSMGVHDPLDGLITCLELQPKVPLEYGEGTNAVDLRPAIDELSEMCGRGDWVTEDVLGIGCLLNDASRLAQMVFNHGIERRGLLCQVLIDAEISLRAIAGSSLLNQPAERRLAFRELGLSIGFHGLEWVRGMTTRDRELTAIINDLLEYRFLAEQIQSFWCVPVHRSGSTWTDHKEINTVMLSTSLAPEGYLQI